DGRSAVVSVAEGADLQEVQALDEVVGVDGLEELAVAPAPERAALVEELLEAVVDARGGEVVEGGDAGIDMIDGAVAVDVEALVEAEQRVVPVGVRVVELAQDV